MMQFEEIATLADQLAKVVSSIRLRKEMGGWNDEKLRAESEREYKEQAEAMNAVAVIIRAYMISSAKQVIESWAGKSWECPK